MRNQSEGVDAATDPRRGQPIPAGSRGRSKSAGALAGVLATLLFLVVHHVVIADIWFNTIPMLFAGAICGWCLAWSYAAAVRTATARTWLAYNATYIGLLVALGVVSLIALDPIMSMAEIMASSDPLGDLMPSAVPLMAWASVVGALIIWATFSRRVGALPAVFVTQTLLVLLIGHNLAILGLVDMSSDVIYRVAEFAGLTLFLGAAFAFAYLGVRRVEARSSHRQSGVA